MRLANLNADYPSAPRNGALEAFERPLNGRTRPFVGRGGGYGPSSLTLDDMESDPTPGAGNAASVDVEYDPEDEPRFAAIVYLRGEHDLATTPAVADAIGRILGSVLVDLSDCDFIDSTIIGTLFDHARSIEANGHVLEIVSPPGGNVARTLELVQMQKLLPIHGARPTPKLARTTEA